MLLESDTGRHNAGPDFAQINGTARVTAASPALQCYLVTNTVTRTVFELLQLFSSDTELAAMAVHVFELSRKGTASILALSRQ